MWVVWAAGKDSLMDIQERFSLEDLLDAHAAVVFRKAAEYAINKSVMEK